MANPYLLLWLEAPLQAWGHDSKFGRRDSLDFPTKSGVLGLLCCARGARGLQTEWLAAIFRWWAAATTTKTRGKPCSSRKKAMAAKLWVAAPK